MLTACPVAVQVVVLDAGLGTVLHLWGIFSRLIFLCAYIIFFRLPPRSRITSILPVSLVFHLYFLSLMMLLLFPLGVRRSCSPTIDAFRHDTLYFSYLPLHTGLCLAADRHQYNI